MVEDRRPSLFDELIGPDQDPTKPLYARPWARAMDDAVARLARAMILAAGVGVFLTFGLNALVDETWMLGLLSILGSLFFGAGMMAQLFLAKSALQHALHLFYFPEDNRGYSRRVRLLAFMFIALSCFVVALGIVSAVAQLQHGNNALGQSITMQEAGAA